MADKPIPKCPMGHEMALIQVAAGGWRYGCVRCATSFKARKTMSCGWLSPIKSTKERALEAALSPFQKPMTLDDLGGNFRIPCWVERKPTSPWIKFNFTPDILDKDSTGYIGLDMEEYLLPKDYGILWRCWREIPTKEELAAAKWEEAVHESIPR